MPRFMASPMRTCRQTPSASCSSRVSTRRSFASSGTVAFSFSSAVYSSISCTVRLSMSVSATRTSVSTRRDARAYITVGDNALKCIHVDVPTHQTAPHMRSGAS